MGEDKFVTLEVLKGMMEAQGKAYQAMIQVVMEDVKSDIKELRKDMEELKVSVGFLSKEYDSAKVETKATGNHFQSDIARLGKRIDQMEESTWANFEEVADHNEYLENQSRRDNIKILGVPESDTEKTWDDTEGKVKELIKSKLSIDEEVEIVRAHRVGRQNQTGRSKLDGSFEPPQPRAIVAKLKSWKLKEKIVKKAREVRPKSIRFVYDLSQRTLEKRKSQIPEMLNARSKGKIAYFVMDKLIIRNKVARPNMHTFGRSSHSSGPPDEAENEESEAEKEVFLS